MHRHGFEAALRLCVCLALILGVNQALAQTPADLTKLSIEDLLEVKIESVSKFEQRLIDAPASVTIVTSDDIKKYGYRNLLDILRSVRGLYGRYDRNYSYLGIRGFSKLGDYNSRVLLLVDGHRMNDNVYDQAAVGNDFLLDVDLIDRVEVIRGPSSSLYGTNAFLGTINVKTKSGEALKGLELSGEGGGYSTYKGRVSYGNRFDNGLEMLVSGSVFGTAGSPGLFFKEYDSPDTNNGIARRADSENFYSVFGKVSYGDFTLEGGYVNRGKVIPTAPYETIFNTDDTETFDERAYSELRYQRQLPWDVTFNGRLFYDWYLYRGHFLYDYADTGDPPFLVTNKDQTVTDSMGGELRFSKTLFAKHKFIVGAEYQYVFRQNQKNYDFDVYVDDKRTSKNWAIYLQDEFELFKNFRVNAGVRYDQYATFGSTVNPRVGLIYQPLEKTIFKFLYGRAFRAPNVYELYYEDSGISQKSNPGLQPETIQSFELVGQQYLGFNLWGSANIYYQRIKDLISQEIDPADDLLVFTNIEGVRQKGLELELDGRWENGVRARLGYTLQESKNVDTHKFLLNSPKHLVKFNAVVPVWRDKLFLGVEEQFTSSRKTLAGHASKYFITNLTLFSQNLFKGLEASASVYNVFNQQYNDPSGGEHIQDRLKQDGTTFRFKLTYRF